MENTTQYEGSQDDFLRRAITSSSDPEETREWVGAADAGHMPHTMQGPTSIRSSAFPINRFPDELLVAIFWELSKGMPKKADVVRASHVCQRWRSVALASAVLWTAIVLSQEEQSEEFLRRSKEALLRVSYRDADPARPPVIMAKLIPHFHHVESLSLHLAYKKPMEFVLASFRSIDAPQLKELRIRFTPILLSGFEVAMDVPVIFNSHLPSLRILALQGVSVPRSSSIFKNLTTLDISDECSFFHPPPTPQQFLDILEQCPSLENLRVVGDRRADTAMPPGRRIHLPHLKSLEVNYDRNVHISKLLSCLSLPSQTTVNVHSDLIETSTINYPLPSDLSTLLSLAQLRMIELRMHSSASTRVTLVGRAGHNPDAESNDVRLRLQMFATSQAAVLRALPTALDLSFTELLVISIADFSEGTSWTSEDWVQVLTPLRNMRAFRLISANHILLCDLFSVLLDIDDNRAMLCPKLALLELIDVDFGDAMRLGLEVFMRGRASRGLSKVALKDVWRVEDEDLSACRSTGVELVLNE